MKGPEETISRAGGVNTDRLQVCMLTFLKTGVKVTFTILMHQFVQSALPLGTAGLPRTCLQHLIFTISGIKLDPDRGGKLQRQVKDREVGRKQTLVMLNGALGRFYKSQSFR